MRLKKLTSILLILALLILCCPGMAAEEAEENCLLWDRETEITQDIRMVETVLYTGSRQSEHYICYTPGGEARPVLAWGDNIRQKQTFTAASERFEGRVLAGINGDYYVMSTGMPLGIVLHDGELISSDAGNAAIGFMEDGSAILGLPGLTMLLTSDTVQCPISGINKDYKNGAFYLYTSDWGETVPLSKDYRCAELFPEEGQKLTVGGEVRLTVGAVRTPEEAAALKDDTLLLCYSGSGEAWENAGMDELVPGAELTLSVRASDERFVSCREALGCLFPLLENGEILPGLDEIDKNKAPRTAIGIREDGTVILYTADGRQSGYAIGLTLREAAERLLELGCVTAGVMDGGASTVLACQLPGEEVCGVRNAPSLGKLRETPQFLLLVAEEKESGELATIGLSCGETVMLGGSRATVLGGGCDKRGAPVPLTGLRWYCDNGSIDDSGVFTAPDAEGTVTVTARCGSVSGSLRMRVISQPDEITVRLEENGKTADLLRVLPGSETELTAEAVWNAMAVCASDELFTWELDGDIGAIDENGLFSAADKAAAGYLTVRCGEASCRLQVMVTDTVICAEDYEHAESGDAPGLKWSPESNRDRVRFGKGSLRLDYDLFEGSVALPMEKYPTELGSSASFWLLSDGSGNNVYSVHEEITILLGSLEHPGWMQFSVDTGIFGRIQALRIGGKGSGTLWLDQLLITSLPEQDLEAPVISIEAQDGSLSAQIWDQAEGVLQPELLKLTVDGKESPFDYDESAGLVSAQLPQPGHSIHVTLTACDRSGNYNSASVLIGEGTGTAFPDMEGHWACRYVDHLHSLGVLSGRLAEDGTVYYDPDSRITRAEFAVMLCRWLKLDTAAYGNELRFADEDDIPSWACDSVRAAAALGLIYGALEKDGLYFMPQQPLTRAQAAVILGRTMPGGRMMADLSWPDAGDIPLWARGYVSELAFMGVMTGNGVTFEPNAPLTRAQAAKLLSELS